MRSSPRARSFEVVATLALRAEEALAYGEEHASALASAVVWLQRALGPRLTPWGSADSAGGGAKRRGLSAWTEKGNREKGASQGQLLAKGMDFPRPT